MRSAYDARLASRRSKNQLDRTFVSVVEALERRALLSATLGTDGVLTITGTSNADQINVSIEITGDNNGGAGPVVVTINGVTQHFTSPAVKAVLVNALGGDDSVTVGGQDSVSQNAPGVSNYINSTINGGDGNDTIAAAVTDTAFVGPSDELDGGNGNDSLTVAHDGSATLNGGDGNDTFFGNGDFALGLTIFGGAGDDTASKNEDASFVLYNGGSGFNTLNTQGSGSSLAVVNLNDSKWVNIHHVIQQNGTTLIGTDQADVLEESGAESATVDGRGGNDTIHADGVSGGSFHGGDGNDSIQVDGFGDTTIAGDAGNDLLIGGTEPDHFSGGTGVDTVDYSSRTANLKIYMDGSKTSGEVGEDDVIDNTVDRVLGGSGNDLIVGSALRSEALYGNAGNDSLFGGNLNDNLWGGDGNDLLDGGLGADQLDGGAGTDIADYHTRSANLVVWLDGSHPSGQAAENDRFDGTVEIVYGGSGNDYLVGTKNNDALYGNGGNDSLFGGGGGIDAFFGGAGNDLIRAKNGNKDYVDGGPGNDSAQTDRIDTVINVEVVTH